jgi:hypothetical protein
VRELAAAVKGILRETGRGEEIRNSKFEIRKD